jgi:hypothetical protein
LPSLLRNGEKKVRISSSFHNLILSIPKTILAFDTQKCKNVTDSHDELLKLNASSSAPSSLNDIHSASCIIDEYISTSKTTTTASTFSADVLKIVTRIFSRPNVSMDEAEGVMQDIGEVAESISDVLINNYFK